MGKSNKKGKGTATGAGRDAMLAAVRGDARAEAGRALTAALWMRQLNATTHVRGGAALPALMAYMFAVHMFAVLQFVSCLGVQLLPLRRACAAELAHTHTLQMALSSP